MDNVEYVRYHKRTPDFHNNIDNIIYFVDKNFLYIDYMASMMNYESESEKEIFKGDHDASPKLIKVIGNLNLDIYYILKKQTIDGGYVTMKCDNFLQPDREIYYYNNIGIMIPITYSQFIKFKILYNGDIITIKDN